MGANVSALPEDPSGRNSSTRRKLEDIPESCIAMVLSYLDPVEIAKLARLNRAFRGASEADFIWIPKLPSTYSYIVSKLPDQGIGGDKSKKDIYAALSRPSTFDGGTKEVWIDKRTGGVCLAISSKAMAITGIDDRRYWNHIPTDESRFQTVAYLQQIWWLEVSGDLEFQFPSGTYSLFFRLQLGRATKRLGRRACNSENVHGWDLKPVKLQLTMPDGQHQVSHFHLDNIGTWAHYHVGDLVVNDGSALTNIKFALTQIDCTHTKGGLCVDSVLIVPSFLGQEMFSSDTEVCKKV
ncbi:F-box protein PP2-A13-like [Andrographis paniculata]|uniref:F-box protein PP2-A13-like n=1 Tax=Andrographis paniculata TaxID=175694 RepID=UPI0021E7E3B0|nr:F-box protein PP2-A13-like [Andrographis paniculata]